MLRCSGGERERLGLGRDLGEDAVELVAGERPFKGARDVAVVLAEVHQTTSELLQRAKVVGCQGLALDDREEQLGLVEPRGMETGRWISSALTCALCIREIEVLPACELPLSTIQNTRRAER